MRNGMGFSFPILRKSEVRWFGRGRSRRDDEAPGRLEIGLAGK